MAPAESDDLATVVAAQLPYLRRFARALTGSQAAGDQYAAATLQAILSDGTAFDESVDPKAALFRVFHGVWFSAGERVETPEKTEGPLAEKAQHRLAGLTPRARVAVLLNSLESFDNASIASIMGISRNEATELVATGWRELDAQVAGHVLIIEDEPIIAMDLKGIVTGLGHTVVGVSDTCDAAIKAALTERPNLILADILLSDGSSGIDAVNGILKTFEVPVIFITAYPERLLTGQRPEPTYLITKPFKEEQVRAAIGQALFFEGAVDAV